MAASNAVIRVFAAIEIGDAARESCAHLIQKLRAMSARVTWVRPENLHLTLRFLGDISEQQIADFAAFLGPQVAMLPPFPAVLRGVGVFPHPRWPSVIWAGFESPDNDAAAIQAITERAAVAIGLPAETRPFAPHVTLGRVRKQSQKGGVFDALVPVNPFVTGAFMVEAVSLFSSELTPQGARYRRLHRLTLDGLRGARDL